MRRCDQRILIRSRTRAPSRGPVNPQRTWRLRWYDVDTFAASAEKANLRIRGTSTLGAESWSVILAPTQVC